ncbi:MAG: hypothetical protein JWO67_681 [Streptosporangiaceae bacterium]|nr:hypothetical protein [Streptosporangiaceae bacterium]
MTARHVAVLSFGPQRPAPAGVDEEEFRLALLEDTYEVVAGLEFVTPALVVGPGGDPGAEAVTWPGTAIVRAATLGEAFAALEELGADQAALVAADAPDLPSLLIGKLLRALGSAPAAATPAAEGGLVALAACLPLPEWLSAALASVDLDTEDGLTRLRDAAPRAGLVPTGPGWHRLRTPADVAYLDPGLEGWDNTRGLLAGHPLAR